MESSEAVSASCSVRLWVRRDSAVVVMGGGLDVAVPEEEPRSSCRSWAREVVLRARRVDSVWVCGGCWKGVWDVGWGCGWDSRGERGSGTRSVAEAREGEEDGVSVPRRSSPSEEYVSSSSWGATYCISASIPNLKLRTVNVHHYILLTAPLAVLSIPAS